MLPMILPLLIDSRPTLVQPKLTAAVRRGNQFRSTQTRNGRPVTALLHHLTRRSIIRITSLRDTYQEKSATHQSYLVPRAPLSERPDFARIPNKTPRADSHLSHSRSVQSRPDRSGRSRT